MKIMEFTGITKASDIEAFQVYFYQTSPTLQKSMANQRLILPLILIILGLFFIFVAPVYFIAIIYFVLAIGVFIGYPRFFEYRIKQQISKMIKSTTMQKHLGKYTVKFTDTGITHISEIGEQSLFWHSVDKAVIVKNYLFIVVGSASGLAIDCNDYSKEHIQSIIDIVDTHIPNKGK